MEFDVSLGEQRDKQNLAQDGKNTGKLTTHHSERVWLAACYYMRLRYNGQLNIHDLMLCNTRQKR